MALTLAEANTVIAGAVKKAQELNIKVCVAVCDGGGRLLAFNRMDGAIWGAVYGSQGKAVASAAMGRPSGAIDPSRVIFQKIGEHEGGHMIGSQGAVPIVRNGVVEGACGVGGGTGEQDEECAAAGAAAL
ncbi:MAG: heme-binding protein [Dehalococcoidia bacterium]|nr:heme-binding protein [Dehalococcoidia bacterium]